MMDIKDLRKEIDEIDEEIVRAFNRRMEISGKIAGYKKERSLPVFDSVREDEKIEALRKLSEEEFAVYTEKLYRHIFDLSREYQSDLIAVEDKTK